jgi:hypothetical protein
MGQTPFMQPLPPQPPYPYYPPVNPIAGPVKVIGIIYAVFAVLALFSVLTMAAMGGFLMQGAASSVNGVPAFSGPFFLIIAVIILLTAVLNGATAYGLLARKSWGRILAIIVSIVSLLSIPFGTILGGFALYFLLRQGAEQDYIRLALGQP